MAYKSFQRVAVAIDGSPAAQAALGLALTIVAPDGELAFIHALNRTAVIAECVTPYGGDATVALEALEDEERDLFVAATGRANTQSLRSTTHSLDGPVGDTIAKFVQHGDFDAVVLGTDAHTGIERFMLGSTAETVLRGAHVPTFITRERVVSRAEVGICRILVAIDESAPANDAVRYAIGLAAEHEANIIFAHVAPKDAALLAEPPYVRAASDYATRMGVASETVELHGTPETAIPIAAEATKADLIAIGTHARTGFDRIRQGSVAEAVIRASTVPVLVIPHAVPSPSRM